MENWYTWYREVSEAWTMWELMNTIPSEVRRVISRPSNEASFAVAIALCQEHWYSSNMRNVHNQFYCFYFFGNIGSFCTHWNQLPEVNLLLSSQAKERSLQLTENLTRMKFICTMLYKVWIMMHIKASIKRKLQHHI